jgi:hypothetical protein
MGRAREGKGGGGGIRQDKGTRGDHIAVQMMALRRDARARVGWGGKEVNPTRRHRRVIVLGEFLYHLPPVDRRRANGAGDSSRLRW